uniref:Uncharacterized protein n=1 Tax=Timema poppense TaxID=170557 RepID=A0A7R9GZC8_TIMPO|nr:unnamed protein product [Timema poppensis]
MEGKWQKDPGHGVETDDDDDTDTLQQGCDSKSEMASKLPSTGRSRFEYQLGELGVNRSHQTLR